MTMLAALADPTVVTAQIGMLEAYFGVALDARVKRLYVDSLRDIEPERFKAACRRLVQSSRFMPKVAELRDAAEAEAQAEREQARKDADAAARTASGDPMRPFGRMSRYVVDRTFKSYVAFERCDCVECWDAKPDGPPRFVPDGTNPEQVCAMCDDTGWNAGTSGGVLRCLCASHNPNLRPDAHLVDMGRWIHGNELVEHERAQAAFFAALKRVGINRQHLREDR